MKRTSVVAFSFSIVALLAAALFASCSGSGSDSDPASRRYTVYTDTEAYSVVQAAGVEIGDGKYVQLPLTTELFNQIAATATADERHSWTEAQIRDWFVGRGFGATEANSATKYVLTESHAIVYSRTGGLVYALVK